MSDFSIQIINANFSYNENTVVFNNHNLILDIKGDQKNKLYGIIGPSGTGKTTLISILGGQLNPQQGEVLINNINIYKVDDLARRSLISMQMQTATSLRGKLKYNILFGLPKKEGEIVYENSYLVEILVKVGLWGLFEAKDGLDTLIGEGGLNLSGGQRQRLNFAGLYLRAKYFRPHLILIDEPTSSLDELSEKAITQMILDLANDALTLVVAHRLKTLDEAVGIFDSSLINSKKDMIFYSRKELQLESQYYRDLIDGNAVLEDYNHLT
ncbi:MAG: ATP-binding cassette domain-containing protein [candidate division SR1 bacterium]|nr:ATP-binding cassette domain-containing protein [candidate division SR1 bacterium]